MKVTRTVNSTAMYCISTPDINCPTDETHNLNDYYTVSFKDKKVTEIKIHCDTTARLSARTIAHLNLLLDELKKEGYALAYEEAQK